jgi:hypothetical protein
LPSGQPLLAGHRQVFAVLKSVLIGWEYHLTGRDAGAYLERANELAGGVTEPRPPRPPDTYGRGELLVALHCLCQAFFGQGPDAEALATESVRYCLMAARASRLTAVPGALLEAIAEDLVRLRQAGGGPVKLGRLWPAGPPWGAQRIRPGTAAVG